MDTQEIFKLIDEVVFRQTGKHLDTLQLGILKSVFNDYKYAQIAQDYKCSEGHARDKAYELWHILSEALGEDLNKSNVRSAIERLIITNSSNNLVNSGRIDKLNFCHNSPQSPENLAMDNSDIIETENLIIEEKLKEAKLETVPRLVQVGLTAEQIAQVLDLPLSLILETL
jgi:DNA-directed RNA polymerase specialized sigma24 family protein